MNTTTLDNSLYAFGWKSYQAIRKKAMDQEHSWAGLAISLSIAFFIVTASTLTMQAISTSLEQERSVPDRDGLVETRSLADLNSYLI